MSYYNNDDLKYLSSISMDYLFKRYEIAEAVVLVKGLSFKV